MRVQVMSDRQLVEAYHNGKEAAFNELLKRYKSKVYSKIMMYVRDRAVAEDIFQDTFVRAIHALIRNIKKMPMTRERDEYNPFDFISSEERTSEEDRMKREVKSDMKKLLNMLPEEQKEIVMMRLHYDMSFKEIADQLDISINTALGRMRYALINLRKLIEKHRLEMPMFQ